MAQTIDIPPPISFSHRPQLSMRNRAKILLGAIVIGFLLLWSLGPIEHATIWTRGLQHSYLPPDATPYPTSPLPPNFEIHRSPRWSPMNETALKEVQDLAYNLTSHKRPTCALHPWHYERYTDLRASSSSFFLAINLHDNAGVSPTFVQELPIVLQFLGPQRVHVSIYENGSTDETPQFLVLRMLLLHIFTNAHRLINFALVARTFDALGTSYSILSKNVTFPKDEGRRINVLAVARNTALAPFYDGSIARHMPNKRFDTVLFMNDIIFCAADVLEVLHSKAEQGAHEACSVDWDWSGRVVYDRWVLRALSGRSV